MTLSRKLGTLVVFGVPAIVGGGIVYALTHGNYYAVATYEAILLFTAGTFFSK